jgi:hypothetical protein
MGKALIGFIQRGDDHLAGPEKPRNGPGGNLRLDLEIKLYLVGSTLKYPGYALYIHGYCPVMISNPIGGFLI